MNGQVWDGEPLKQLMEREWPEEKTGQNGTSLERMELSGRNFNVLKRAGYRNLGDVIELARKTGLKGTRNLGRKSRWRYRAGYTT